MFDQKYGTTDSEKDLQKIMVARQIVKEIVDYGVSQEQILLIIQGLASEIENHEVMVELVSHVRDILKQKEVLILDKGAANGSA